MYTRRFTGNISSKRSGFTIVELLIVIVVIGILAALVMTSYGNITKRAKESSLQSDLANAAKQLKAYYATESKYPAAIDDCPNPASANICLNSSPGNSYTYSYDNSANPKTFNLKAVNGDLAYKIDSTNSAPVATTAEVIVNETFTNTGTSYSGTIQTWIAPADDTYTIEAWGAEGGTAPNYSYTSGKGARMKGDFTLSAGDKLYILVGHKGGSYTYTAGGGGGTFVMKGTAVASAVPLLVAGGGGGSGGSGGAGYNASTSTNGTAGHSGYGYGTNGYSNTNCSNGGWGSSGAGYRGDSCSGSTYSSEARSFQNGGNGAIPSDGYNDFGGFGGGGAGASNGGGGGGGYSGGGQGGGGGGSYNAGTNQSNSAGVQTGHGKVTITNQ